MERGTHENVGGGVQPDVDMFGDYYISRDEWTAIYTNRHETLVIRIETTDGMVGWGESQAPVGSQAVKEIVEQLCRPVLIGQNPLDREHLWYRMYSSMRERGHITGFFVDALAGIDLALHDLVGKELGLPVYRLLGGKMRDEIELHVGISDIDSTALAETAAEHASLGYKAF
jgi:L-alanine-DL-glutamate epimerase-like enolase superfamily enzyme